MMMNPGGCMTNPRLSKEQQKERIRQRVRVQIDEANYNFIPEVKPPDYRDNDAHLRVVIYVHHQSILARR